MLTSTLLFVHSQSHFNSLHFLTTHIFVGRIQQQCVPCICWLAMGACHLSPCGRLHVQHASYVRTVIFIVRSCAKPCTFNLPAVLWIRACSHCPCCGLAGCTCTAAEILSPGAPSPIPTFEGVPSMRCRLHTTKNGIRGFPLAKPDRLHCQHLVNTCSYSYIPNAIEIEYNNIDIIMLRSNTYLQFGIPAHGSSTRSGKVHRLVQPCRFWRGLQPLQAECPQWTPQRWQALSVRQLKIEIRTRF